MQVYENTGIQRKVVVISLERKCFEKGMLCSVLLECAVLLEKQLISQTVLN